MLTLLLMEAFWAGAIYLTARKFGLRPRPVVIPLVLASAFPVLAAEAWATVFRVEPGSATADRPDLVVDMLSYLFYASIPLSLGVLAFAKGYRIAATVFALPQIPLAWLVGFLGVMQVTGVWI
ncbi:hypothetical protein [Caulobacter sp. BK020]|uniref:hypothetical protein n=1 Tax=Caulobacter sp. BK020 TaxID=2512117 RepID=UPI001049C598|nr:hypothetical protein [Caulobacter sp. BK020]TCS10128.1 hypothetical protein EV278_12082 [Caulobacter sp. BK020]